MIIVDLPSSFPKNHISFIQKDDERNMILVLLLVLLASRTCLQGVLPCFEKHSTEFSTTLTRPDTLSVTLVGPLVCRGRLVAASKTRISGVFEGRGTCSHRSTPTDEQLISRCAAIRDG